MSLNISPKLRFAALVSVMALFAFTAMAATARGEARRGGHAPVAEAVEEAAPVESPVGGHAPVQETTGVETSAGLRVAS